MKIKPELCPASPEECRFIRTRFREDAPLRDRWGLEECGSFGIKSMGHTMTIMLYEAPESKVYLGYLKHQDETFIDLTTLFTDGSFLTTTNSPTASYTAKLDGHFLQIFKDGDLERCWRQHAEGTEYLRQKRSVESKHIESDAFKTFLFDLNLLISAGFSFRRLFLDRLLLKHLRYSKPISQQADLDS